MSIKIILAEDHKIVRDGLKTLLENEEDMEVIAETEDGRTAVKLAKQLFPDVIIMDITMPDVSGIEGLKKIIEFDPNAKVLMCSAMGQEAMVIDCLEADPVHLDDLARRLALGTGPLSGILLQLELKGLVSQAPGKRFSLMPGVGRQQSGSRKK